MRAPFAVYHGGHWHTDAPDYGWALRMVGYLTLIGYVNLSIGPGRIRPGS